MLYDFLKENISISYSQCKDGWYTVLKSKDLKLIPPPPPPQARLFPGLEPPQQGLETRQAAGGQRCRRRGPWEGE